MILFQREKEMSNRTWKDIQHLYSSGKHNSKPWGITSHLSKWLSSKRIKITKQWGGREENGIFVHCLWGCKLMQPLRKTVWRFLRKLKIELPSVQFSSVQLLSHVRLFVTPWITAHQASCLSPTPEVYSNPCPSSWWCHPAISSSVIPFSSCHQSLPASGSFPMSQLFTWGGQSTGVSISASVLPMNTQDWSPLGWTGWISLQSKGLSRVFSNITAQKHQFFGTHLSSQSSSHIHLAIPRMGIQKNPKTLIQKICAPQCS